MKKICLTVFTALALTLGAFNSFAADTVSESLKNGKVNGEFKVWYQTNDNDAGNNSIFEKQNSTFDAGFNIGYRSDTYKGFSFTADFYAIDDLGTYENLANNSIHGVNNSKTASWLGHAYLSYNKGNTLVNFGRQDLKTPLIDSDAWAVFSNSFNAVYLQNTDIANTSIVASYVFKERTLKSDRFNDFGDDGAFLVGMVNKSLENTTLTGYYYYMDTVLSDVNALYLEAATKIQKINLAGQYLLLSPDGANMDNTSAFGLKISSKVGLFDISGAFSSVDSGTMIAAKFSDSSIKTPLFTQTISGDGDIAGATDTDSYKLSVGFNPTKTLNVTAAFGYYDHGSNSSAIPNDETKSHELTLKYTGFKNITIFSAYVNSDHRGVGGWKGATIDDSLNTFRLWASYKF